MISKNLSQLAADQSVLAPMVTARVPVPVGARRVRA